jgi:ABC-type amino acid transport substrate-binding protein
MPPLVKTSFLAVLLALAGCGPFPRDPEKTLEHVKGGTLRVGLVENPPWVVRRAGKPAGVEVALVQKLADELGAKPEWHWGGEQAHMEALEKFELDLLAGGITRKTEWRKKVGLTSAYLDDQEKHGLATPPGENGWIKLLDEFLHSHAEEARQLLQEEEAHR